MLFRSLLELAATLLELTATLPKLAVICHKSIKLADFGRIPLSSVLPRHFYCNWASPVIFMLIKPILVALLSIRICIFFHFLSV